MFSRVLPNLITHINCTTLNLPNSFNNFNNTTNMKPFNRSSRGFGRKPNPWDTYHSAVIHNIREYGQHICGVHDPIGNDPSFFYTIGNSYDAVPPVELFCFWKSPIGSGILKIVSYQMRTSPEFCEKVFSQDISYHWGFLGLDEEVPVALRQVSGLLDRVVKEKYVCQLGKPEFSKYIKPHQLIQVILPDMNHRFPGDPLFDDDLSDTIPSFLHLPYDPHVYSVV